MAWLPPLVVGWIRMLAAGQLVLPSRMSRKSSPDSDPPSGVRGGFGMTTGGVFVQSTASTEPSGPRRLGAPRLLIQYAPAGAFAGSGGSPPPPEAGASGGATCVF